MGLRNFPTNKTNPFRELAIQHIKKEDKIILLSTSNPDLIIESSTGEIKGHALFAKKMKVDKSQFIKIYINSISGIFELSKSAGKVFAYLASILQVNKDYLFLDIDECMKETGYLSKKTIVEAISELIDKQFLARSNIANKYFINPTIFFNGNRLTLLEDYMVNENEIGNEELQEVQGYSENNS